jgi:hypothetical protein
LQLLTYA